MAYPTDSIQLPRRSLGFLPTPVVELRTLARYLGGPRILMKRDDQTGLALGGNKVRKLEYLMGDALAQGADCVVTGGAVQSNHCRQTAAAAAVCGMACHLALGGSPPALLNGNLLLDSLLGATIHWSGDCRKGENIPQICAGLRQEGKKPYVIPYGGSNEIGAAGFVEAVREVAAQLGPDIAALSHVVFASSSGGTHAGLLLGKILYGLNFQVIGINIDKGESGERPLREHILDLANSTASHLGVSAAFSAEDVVLLDDYVGAGYAVIGDLEREAIKLTARHEGILLDPVYTGRAMGGLLDLIKKKAVNRSDTVLFWHTGGSPALFAYAEELSR
ncbi:MAG: D-cysteine desulfhydrase family protein [Desulfoprunum sp.]|nr:D-cysteine desulfhydrase family protein [Desulfoprunum sp.]